MRVWGTFAAIWLYLSALLFWSLLFVGDIFIKFSSGMNKSTSYGMGPMGTASILSLMIPFQKVLNNASGAQSAQKSHLLLNNGVIISSLFHTILV
jgi:hypothetical protein